LQVRFQKVRIIVRKINEIGLVGQLIEDFRMFEHAVQPAASKFQHQL